MSDIHIAPRTLRVQRHLEEGNKPLIMEAQISRPFTKKSSSAMQTNDNAYLWPVCKQM